MAFRDETGRVSRAFFDLLALSLLSSQDPESHLRIPVLISTIPLVVEDLPNAKPARKMSSSFSSSFAGPEGDPKADFLRSQGLTGREGASGVGEAGKAGSGGLEKPEPISESARQGDPRAEMFADVVSPRKNKAPQSSLAAKSLPEARSTNANEGSGNVGVSKASTSTGKKKE